MFVKHEFKDGMDHFELDGKVDEHAELSELIGQPRARMRIGCKGISAMNSVGTKKWRDYFKTASDQGSELSFEQCSIALIDVASVVPGLFCGGQVESLFIPYLCSSCEAELQILLTLRELKDCGFKPTQHKCSLCQGEAIYDDNPDEHLGFLAED